MIDPKKIFELFSSIEGAESVSEEVKIASQLEEFTHTPAFKIAIFKKLIINHTNFNISVLNMLKRTNEEFDMGDVENAGEFITYTKAWEYIKDLDARDIETFTTLKKSANEELITALALSINYFEGFEEYEKCAHLKKLSDISRHFIK